jgi:UDP-N-acetylmuramyl pentapeptide phosphotransferase/UDP-N-acetylglucosamine-1-phosphate transferase
MEETNWLSVIISSLIPIIIGFIYYHKNLFGKAWTSFLNINEEDLKKGNKPLILGLSIVMSFLLSIFLINFNNSKGQEAEFDNFAHGAWHGFFVAFLVAMPIVFISGLFEVKKIKNLIINVIYWMLTLAIMGGILDAMNHWPN